MTSRTHQTARLLSIPASLKAIRAAERMEAIPEVIRLQDIKPGSLKGTPLKEGSCYGRGKGGEHFPLPFTRD